MRERASRKAKDRAVEHLHEITTNRLNSSVSSKTKAKRQPQAAITSALIQNDENSRSHLNDSDVSDDEVGTRRNRGKTPSKLTSKKLTKKTPAKQKPDTNTNKNVDEPLNSLYQQIFQSKIPLEIIIDEWIELYQKQREQALLDLMHLILRSSGCKGKLTRNLFKSNDYLDVINDLVDEFDSEVVYGESTNAQQVPIEYPLINNQNQYKRFKMNFCDFLHELIQKCQYSIIYDSFMMQNLLNLLIGLCDSQVRALRHTATLTVLKIITSLINVLIELETTKQNHKKQLDNEVKKTSAKRANDRIQLLNQKLKEFQENESDIKSYLDSVMNGVFVHRYRDINADIRGICISELGLWMSKYPQKYLNDSFLKFIGWTLYDKNADVRMKCLNALNPLYLNNELEAKLELFTQRFKQRIIEMSLDREADVAVKAIKLLTNIIKTSDKFEDKDCESIYELVFHTNRSISQAAGEFLNEKLLEKLKESRQSGNENDENAAYIKLIIQFLIESELHDHPTYLIDSLWNNKNEALRDWKCMCDMLLNKDDTDEQLDDKFEYYLIEIITCCVRHASTGEMPIAREQNTQLNGLLQIPHTKLTQKELKALELDRDDLTEHFIEYLPQLIEKYNADAEKLVFLLQIPVYFDLKIYTNSRKEAHLDKLLDKLQEIIGKHTDMKVLEYCSVCLSHLCNEDYAIYTKCNLIRSLVIDNLVTQFKTFMASIEDSELDEDELYPLVSCLKRLSVFGLNHNILNATSSGRSLTRESSNDEMSHISDLWKHVKTLLKACELSTLDVSILSCCFNLMKSILCQLLDKLIKIIACKYKAYYEFYRYENESDDEMKSEEYQEINELIQYISKLFKKYFKYVNRLLSCDIKDMELESYLEISDLAILFNKTHFVENILKKANVYLPHVDLTKEPHRAYKGLQDSLSTLVLDCTFNDINMLLVICTGNVLVNESLNTYKQDSAQKIEDLHRRRCILTAFCKLIIYNIIPIRYLIDLAQAYHKYFNAYGDILKYTIVQCKDINRIATIKALSSALQREFINFLNESILSKENPDDHLNGYEEFQAIKELARKYLSLFGNDASKVRDVLIEFHQDSYEYLNKFINDTNSKYLCQYFLILNEFLGKLNNTDKKNLLNSFIAQKQILKFANKNVENWSGYFMYRDNLISSSKTTAAPSVSILPEQEQQQQGDDVTRLNPLSSTVLETASKSTSKKSNEKRPSIDLSHIQLSATRKQSDTVTNSSITIIKMSDKPRVATPKKRSHDESTDDVSMRIERIKMNSTKSSVDNETEAKSDEIVNENELPNNQKNENNNQTFVDNNDDNDESKVKLPSPKRYKKASEPINHSMAI